MQSFQEVGIPLDDLLSKLGDLIQVINPDGHIIYANSRWMERLGYASSDLKELNFLDNILDESFWAIFLAVSSNLHCVDCVNNVRLGLNARNGEHIIVEVSLIPRVNNNVLESIVCVFHELSDENEGLTELARMFSMSVDMLGIADFEGNFVKLNPAWEQVLGYSLDELIGQPFITFVHPDDVERTLNESQSATTAQSTQTFENRYICKDGSFRWISWHYSSYPDAQRIYFVARDITSQKHNQDELQAAKDQLEAILDNSGTIIGLKDMDGAYILVNQEFANLFGNGNKEALLGQHDDEIFPRDIAHTLIINDREVVESGETLRFEEHLPGDDGLHIYLTTRFIIHDTTYEPYAVCMVAKDITERKLTEMQLLTRNQAIENSPSGISIADARLPDMPLIYINPAFEAQTGYSFDEVIGRNCRFLQGDDRDQEEIAKIRQAIQEERPCSVVLRNYRKDGTMFYNELSLAPIHNEDGVLTHYVGISTDVTERFTAAEQIRKQNETLVEMNHSLALARKQAEDATRLKSHFLATMSHELRTPLNAIIGYTEIQLAGMTGELNTEQLSYQERVLANADHLLELINDVLDIAKIEAGRLDLVEKPFNLRNWLDDIVAQMEGLAKDKQLDFSAKLDDEMPEYIQADPARLRQIAINLLSNAIKFTNEGFVKIEILKSDHNVWKLVVEDSGTGIASHLQETVFEEFRQADSSSRRKAGGTGLGLSIVRKLALMMGGNIRLKSQLGEGSQFTVTLSLISMDNPDHKTNESDKDND